MNIIRVYHMAAPKAAQRILDGLGLDDQSCTYMRSWFAGGVWISDRADQQAVHFLFEAEVAEREVIDFEFARLGLTHREFLAPAEILNRYEWRLVREGPAESCA